MQPAQSYAGSSLATAPTTTVAASPLGGGGFAPSISPILATFGAINSAIGAYYQSQSLRNNLRFQADMARINARVAESNAEATLLAGQRMVQNQRLKTAALKSSQRVAFAANGVDLGSQTAVNVLTSTDYMGEFDANTIEANAIRAAFGYRTQATNERNTALLSDATGASVNPLGAAAGSMLSNAGTVAERWYKYKKDN